MSLPKIPSETDDYQMTAVIGGGLAICGIAPKRRLVTFATDPCWNCQGRVLRRFSGSSWYEDDYLCLDCGENVGTGYRPFRRAWRKASMAEAESWLPDFVEREAFFQHTSRMIREEMDGDHEPTVQDHQNGSAT